MFDVEFYAALRGRAFGSESEATLDFVEHGMGQRLSPHPFLDVLSLPGAVRKVYRSGRVNPVLQHLTGSDGLVRPIGPLSDSRDPDGLRGHLLEVAGRLGRQRDARPAATPPTRIAGRTSVVVLSDDSRSTMRAAVSVVRHADDLDVEVVVADRGLPPHVVLGLHAWACAQFSGTPGVEDWGWLWSSGMTRLAVVDDARDVAHLPCTGDVVVRLDTSCEVRRGWLRPLLAALDDPSVAAVQPLLLQPNDLIAAAGLSVDGVPLLAGHPPEDALGLDGVPVPDISDLAVALRAGEGESDRGSGDALRVAPTSWVSTSSIDVGVGSADLGVVPRSEGQLRWSIKLPSPPGGFGDGWGDTHYAEAVASALRRRGQDVVTRRRGAHDAGPTHLDDVALALRGLHPISPTPGQLNVLWVISHPDDVDLRELEGYDLVCAASTVWAEEMSVRAGREVVPLLQASEFTRPADDGGAPGGEATVVFVGTNLGQRERPLVWQAVEAEVPLAVYGPGWQDLPAGIWRGEHVANESLPGLYREHGIVLADHWPDMARHGFIANRVFDAVAAGARVISDDVAGLHDVFDSQDVVIARTPDEVRQAVSDLQARHAPAAGETAPLSFGHRAHELIERVSRLRLSG